MQQKNDSVKFRKRWRPDMLITTQDGRSVVNFNEADASALTVKAPHDESDKFDLCLITNYKTVYRLGTFEHMNTAIDVMNDIADQYLAGCEGYLMPKDPGELPC